MNPLGLCGEEVDDLLQLDAGINHYCKKMSSCIRAMPRGKIGPPNSNR